MSRVKPELKTCDARARSLLDDGESQLALLPCRLPRMLFLPPGHAPIPVAVPLFDRRPSSSVEFSLIAGIEDSLVYPSAPVANRSPHLDRLILLKTPLTER
jgi:hypothetical protein